MTQPKTWRPLVLIAIGAGCGTGLAATPELGSRDPNANGGGEAGGGPPSQSTAVTGVPCDVADVLAKRCATCHGRPPSNGAPMPMVTYEDLVAMSRSDSSKRVAVLAVERMKDATRPMPPSGASVSDIAVLEGWVIAGLPRGTCEAPVDAGGGGAFDTPTVCTSGTHWSGSNEGSAFMFPGRACLDCHIGGEAPFFSAAGSVYPTAHEPDDCNGSDGATTVVITDANGKTFALPVNAVGNFFMNSTFAMPYRAKVITSTKTRAMSTPQSSADCNACHTEKGDKGAPGRVIAP